MRIIGGKYKGRKIAVGKHFRSRPTTDFAREGLFNILTNHFDFSEIHFLDLFSGTGSIGFEAYSRGCTKAELVDIDRKSVFYLKQNIHENKMEGIRAVCMDVFDYISVCHERYHLIFADPPFAWKRITLLPDYIFDTELLHQNGWFVLEHSGANKFTEHKLFANERCYGNVRFSFFHKK